MKQSREMKFRIWDKFKKEFYYPLGGLHACYCISENHIIQQYTGFKDKSGEKIYEGDILERSGDYKWGAIEFERGKFVVNLQGARVFDLGELFEEGEKPKIAGNNLEK